MPNESSAGWRRTIVYEPGCKKAISNVPSIAVIDESLVPSSATVMPGRAALSDPAGMANGM